MPLRQEDSALMISLLKPKHLQPASGNLSTRWDTLPVLDGLRDQYEKQTEQGDEIAARILGITPPDWGALAPGLRRGLQTLSVDFVDDRGGFAVSRPALPLLDALAVIALDDERPHDAAALFAAKLALSVSERDKADALCSMAYCAVCLRQFDDAAALARASLDYHSMQPRARCILGLCALQGGDRKTAQYSLALAARMARSNRDYVELSQAAQRLLLILHFEE